MLVKDLLTWMHLDPDMELLAVPIVVLARRKKKSYCLELLRIKGEYANSDKTYTLADVPEEPWEISAKAVPPSLEDKYEFKKVVMFQPPAKNILLNYKFKSNLEFYAATNKL